MAKADVKIVQSPYDNHPTRSFPVIKWSTTSEDAVIYPGEPVKLGSNNDAIILDDGDPLIGTDTMLGIAASESDASESADGTVDVYLPMPGTVFRCAANTGSNLAAGILYDSVTFDVSGSAAAGWTFTVDENEGSDPDVHGLIIVDYDADEDTVDFMININATILSPMVS